MIRASKTPGRGGLKTSTADHTIHPSFFAAESDPVAVAPRRKPGPACKANSVTAQERSRRMSTRNDDRYSDDSGMRMDKGSSGAPLLAGLMIGGLIGASAMLLLAPQA